MVKQKTFGIDARFYGEAGPGRYTKNIVTHLEKIDTENKYKIFLNKKGFEEYIPKNPNFSKVLSNYKWYSFNEQFGFLNELLKHKLDLLYIPHFNIPVLYPKRIVTAIPDLIMHEFSTEKGTTLPLVYFRFKKLVYRFVVFWAIVRSKKIIVPSYTVMEEFLSKYSFTSKNKYTVAYEGVDPSLKSPVENPNSVIESLGIKVPFILYISSMYEHKNVYKLIEAFKILKSKFGFSGQLVLVGKKDAYSEDILKLIKNLNMEEYIKLPGLVKFVSDKEIVALRQKAQVYVFPSLKEGFSLTPLEGMYMDLPCAISDIPCHREIYNDAALYFNPHDELNMAQVINKLLFDENLREELIKRGHKLEKKYSWDITAKITLDVLKDSFKNI